MKEEQERTPLRVVLQNFINHVENLETYEDSYDKEFQDLKLFSETLKTSGEYSCKEGEKEYNRKKNRYKDILPFDYSRVTLSEYVGVPGSDYINANYIKGASGSPAYIASQGPLPHTVNDFWRMVVECEVQVIVMACNEEESGKHKCENYWVEKEGEERKFGMVAIKLLKASTICPDFLVRTMKLRYVNSRSIPEERVVCQFHYGAWPDHGVPGLVRPLLEMVRLVRDTQASETLPVLVHCSAGCGRTGTICAIDFVWGLLRAGKLRLDFSLFKLVRDMRKQRIAMVQTKDQYILVHQAVRELFQDQLRMIQSHPYENIDVRGLPILPASFPKSCILQPRQSVSSEEKQDGREKEIGSLSSVVSSEQASVSIADSGEAPPLPRKKRIHTLSSKQEKEVENLTQKQLSIASASGNTKVHSSCVVENLVGGDDGLFTASDKNLRRVITEASAKALDRTPEAVKLSKNPSAPEFSRLGESLKVSVDSSPSSSIAEVQYSMAPSQAEATSNVQKPCIAKLKALFESNSYMKDKDVPNPMKPVDGKPRPPQQVTRSHSLGAVRKPHKFSQFNAASPEISIHSQHSSDSSEVVRFRTATSIHSDACGPQVKEMSEIAYNSKLKTNKLSKPSTTNCEMVPNKSEPSSVAKPLKLSHNAHFSGGKLALSNSFSGILYSHEKSLDTDVSFPPSTCFTPGDSRPALPVKRSKSLKVQSTADHFKLSVAKRNHGVSQDLSSSEDSALFSITNSYENTGEICQLSSNSKDCESCCHSCESSLSSISNPRKMCSCQSSPAILKSSSITSSEIKTSELKSSSRPDFQNIKSELDPGNRVVHLAGPSRSSMESEAYGKFPERKKVSEHIPKSNRDICRAQSLHFKREKSSPHISLSHPQERICVNVSKVEPVSSVRHPGRITNISPSHPQENIYSNINKIESLVNARHPSDSKNIIKLPEDSCRNAFPSQLPNNIPVEASNIIEDCRSYLLSEGVPTSAFDDSQQIAAASARHKVDTVAGGLGVRERRNSFRCAVGQAVDEKSTWVESGDKGMKWIKQGPESQKGPRGEDMSVKRQPESKPINPPGRLEHVKIQNKPVERCKVIETNVIPKNPPLVQKSSIPNDCKYVGSIKVSENIREVNSVEKVGARAMEPRTVVSDIAQKNVGVNGKKSSDSSLYQISSPPKWKQSVVTGVKKTSYIPPKPNFSHSPMSEMPHSPPQGNGQGGVQYGWSPHQSSVHPQKMGPSLPAHSIETMGAQSNKNSAVPLEVDVDQVAASMKNSLPGKVEGAKSPTSPDISNQGNSSTHFTRALEAIHQTAANLLRTKFSRPGAPSSSVSPRNLEPRNQVGQPSQSQLPLPRLQQNGSPQREVRNPDAGDVRRVVRKQQQYL